MALGWLPVILVHHVSIFTVLAHAWRTMQQTGSVESSDNICGITSV